MITFTPPPGSGGLQENTERQQPQEPTGQRTPRKRTHNSEWDLNQRLFNQNKPQEISHTSPVEQANIYNTEQPSVSYLQLPTRKATDFVQNAVTQGIGEDTAKQQHGTDSVCQKHTLCRHARSIQTLLEMTQSHQAEGQLLNNYLECSLSRELILDSFFLNLQCSVFKHQ